MAHIAPHRRSPCANLYFMSFQFFYWTPSKCCCNSNQQFYRCCWCYYCRATAHAPKRQAGGYEIRDEMRQQGREKINLGWPTYPIDHQYTDCCAASVRQSPDLLSRKPVEWTAESMNILEQFIYAAPFLSYFIADCPDERSCITPLRRSWKSGHPSGFTVYLCDNQIRVIIHGGRDKIGQGV